MLAGLAAAPAVFLAAVVVFFAVAVDFAGALRARGAGFATSDSGNATPFSICTRMARRSSEMRNTAT